MEILVVRGLVQAVLPRRVFAPARAVGYTVHPLKCFLKGYQVLAGSSIRPVLVRFIDMAQPGKVPGLPLTPDVLQVPAAP